MANTTDASTSPSTTYVAETRRRSRRRTHRKPRVASRANAALSGRIATGSPPPTTPSTRVSSAPPVSRVRASSTGTPRSSAHGLRLHVPLELAGQREGELLVRRGDLLDVDPAALGEPVQDVTDE